VRRHRRVTRARLRALLHYDSRTGEFRWRKRVRPSIQPGDIAGTLDNRGYRRISINGRSYAAHHLAWFYMRGNWCSQVIDHRDLDPSNNRWTNLRRATRSQNNANRRIPRNNACGLKGVAPDRSRWRGSIRKNGRRRHLGIFLTPQAAHAAYVKAARKLFGKFAGRSRSSVSLPGRYDLRDGELVTCSPNRRGHAAVKYAVQTLSHAARRHDGADRRDNRLQARCAHLLRHQAPRRRRSRCRRRSSWSRCCPTDAPHR
jgi:hypothetical protein